MTLNLSKQRLTSNGIWRRSPTYLFHVIMTEAHRFTVVVTNISEKALLNRVFGPYPFERDNYVHFYSIVSTSINRGL